MNGSGKAGSGNNRRRPKRRGKDNHSRQDGNASYPNGTLRNSGGDAQKPRERSVSENQRHQNRNSRPESSSRSKADASHWKEQRGPIPYRSGFSKKVGENQRGKKQPFFDRPKWVPPKISTEPLPVPDCPWCGKPIKDISFAISDKNTDAPVHFECVAARITEGEILEKGDVVTYIGGGRFGVVCFSGSGNSYPAGRNFKIKKVIEWENKEKRAEWRSSISDRYSIS